MSSVIDHYRSWGHMDGILAGLKAAGKDLSHLSAADLAPIDEFHIRGRDASIELAEMAGVQTSWKVLDVGSGLGGPARFLADRYGCHVTGIDLTPEFVSLATEFSRIVRLQHLNEFQRASALSMPFPDATFDLAWTQHVQMNIEDKAGLYAEVQRVLKPGGRFVFYDILAGPNRPIYFPVPWASGQENSFLIEPDKLRSLLESTGFKVREWRDLTELSRQWFSTTMERLKNEPPSPLGLHLILGETGAQKLRNVFRALLESPICVFAGLLERA